MPIVGITGPEGAGKSLMMAREATIHHRMGGKVFCFPGFEVMNNRGRVISELLKPEDWVTLPPELHNILICIDEVTNFFSNHTWYNRMNDIFAAGVLAQRRKRSLCVIYTGPFFEWLPNRIRDLTHEVIRCRDYYWKARNFKPYIKRGEEIIFSREDHRGVLSGEIGKMTRQKIFLGKPYWKNYNTEAVVGLTYQYDRVKMKGRDIVIGTDGKVVSNYETGDTIGADIERLITESNTDKVREAIRGVVQYLKDKGIRRFPAESIKELVAAQGLNISMKKIGGALKSFNWYYRSRPGPEGSFYEEMV